MIGAIALAAAAAAAADAGPLERCDPPSGWAAVAARGTRYVLFGETPGTAQGPALVGDVACALAFQGERLLIAVEQPSRDNAALQAAWALPDDRFADTLRAFGWWRDDGDGRGRTATYELLRRLHRLRAGGRPIDVVAFADEPDQRTRVANPLGHDVGEAAQAANIRRADAGRYDHVIVLTGTLHAAKQPVVRGSAAFQPMAMRLGPASAVTSLAMRSGTGTAWNCQPRGDAAPQLGRAVTADAPDCGAHPIAATASLSGAAMGLGTAPGAQPNAAYDGWFWLGRVVASSPLALAAPSR